MCLRMPLLPLSPLLPRPRPPCRLLPPLLRQLRPIHLHLCRHLLPAFVAVRIGVLFLALHRPEARAAQCAFLPEGSRRRTDRRCGGRHAG